MDVCINNYHGRDSERTREERAADRVKVLDNSRPVA